MFFPTVHIAPRHHPFLSPPTFPIPKPRPPPPSATSLPSPPPDLSSFPIFDPPKPPPPPSPFVPADPDLYRIGFARSVRVYGAHFLESPSGIGLFASRHVPPLRRARLVVEIPLELLITVTRSPPYLFFPDLIPFDHPIFPIINNTHPADDHDLRLASLLLFAIDLPDSLWQFYTDFLPDIHDTTNLILASDVDLQELQNPSLAARAAARRRRAIDFWERNWHPQIPLKIRRLAPDPDRFLWALATVQTRRFEMDISIGAFNCTVSMLAPYADMLNHSFKPNCFLHWRSKDRMLEVLINAGQEVREGEELTLSYAEGASNDVFMERYGFSSPDNPWDRLEFSGDSRIHLDTFLSVFNIAGLPDEYYHNWEVSGEDGFVDGAVIAAARSLPTWSDGDMPPVPSTERRAAKELQAECARMLEGFPTSLEEDMKIMETDPPASRMREVAIKYRMDRKLLIKKVIEALEVYREKILF